MTAFANHRRIAIRYWEKRRVAYNCLLVPPAFAGWFLRGVLPAAVGDEVKIGLAGILSLFALYAFAANICFSFVYAAEFLFLHEREGGYWKTSGRTLVFTGGCVLAVMLAFWGGVQVAIFEFNGFR